MTHGLFGGNIRAAYRQIGDTREQEQGRLGEENVEKEQVVLCIAFGQTVKGNDAWDIF